MTIAENFTAIRTQITKACKAAGRAVGDVTLVAVSKVQPDERIDAALAAGHRIFGENRVQDAQERWSMRKAADPTIRLHLIGSLQSNKAKDAVALFDVIETVDRESLVTELAKEIIRQQRTVTCFVQVNTGAEDQKGGVLPAGLPALLEACQTAGLKISGLMCIPPVDQPPELHFALLKKLGLRHGLEQLSMGMSGDFKEAIALGATSVRIGTALFGDRV